MSAAIEFHRVSKRFTGKPGSSRGGEDVLAVKEVNLRIAPQEVVSIIGPSGCGKSTRLSMGADLVITVNAIAPGCRLCDRSGLGD